MSNILSCILYYQKIPSQSQHMNISPGLLTQDENPKPEKFFKKKSEKENFLCFYHAIGSVKLAVLPQDLFLCLLNTSQWRTLYLVYFHHICREISETAYPHSLMENAFLRSLVSFYFLLYSGEIELS